MAVTITPDYNTIIKFNIANSRLFHNSPWSRQVLIKVSSNGRQLYPISFMMMMHTKGASTVCVSPLEFRVGHKTQHHVGHALINFSISLCQRHLGD
jgi:uncharacterized phosphosugar-binding protein